MTRVRTLRLAFWSRTNRAPCSAGKFVPAMSIASVTSTATSRRNSSAGHVIGTKPIISAAATSAVVAGPPLVSPHGFKEADAAVTQALINAAKMDKVRMELLQWCRVELKEYKSVNITG